MGKSNTLTGQVLTDLSWQLLPMSRTLSKFIVYVEGAEVLLFVGATPTAADAFKIPDGAALEWPATVHDVWVRGVDTATVVYYIA